MSPAPDDGSPGEDDFFNDLSRQPHSDGATADRDRRNSAERGSDNNEVPKQKRIACVLCRKRKLRCDGNKPSCATCTRLQHDCSYDEVRRKSGPKRGYVKALEARLAQVETLLKTNHDDEPQPKRSAAKVLPVASPPVDVSRSGAANVAFPPPQFDQPAFQHDASMGSNLSDGMLGTDGLATGLLPPDDSFSWEMIGLGLDEPLPPSDVVDELTQLYFDKVHPSLPTLHQSRFRAAMNLAPHMRPPVCLRYAMWCNAAAVSDKYEDLHDLFYQRSRRYIQQDEMKGHGETMITVGHCQTWCLIATYEFKLMYFPRAWVSAGRACRLAQMMGMHRLDGTGLDVKQCLPPARDVFEREERRRAFWMSFCIDRYSSIGTGWPMTIEEQDIMTCLPCDEESYRTGRAVPLMSLDEALEPHGAPKLSGFAGVAIMACLFGRNLTHLHRPGSDDRDDSLDGDFWKRHRSMDNILLNTALALPEHCRLPAGVGDPNVVFLNMNIHTSTICLHQAAIFKADKNRMSARISAESKVRCITAAAETASIMRTVSHMDLSAMNPFISFCLYVASRVFVQYLKSRPNDTQAKSSLQFLLSAMHAIKRKNPLTESFLVQLDVDLESAGLDDSRAMRNLAQSNSTQQQSFAAQRSHAAARSSRMKFPSTYGDHGLGRYNDGSNDLDPHPQAEQADRNNSNKRTMSGFPTHSGAGFQSELPNRARTPASAQFTGSQRSPQYNNHMDISPDASSVEHLTPGSTGTHHGSGNNASSHSSNTSFSPPIQQETLAFTTGQTLDGITEPSSFDLNKAAFTADYDMHGIPAATSDMQSGFVLPQDWTGSTGFTPGSSGMALGTMGMTPGALNDVMNMSEQDWTSVLDTFAAENMATNWESGEGQQARAWQ